MTFGGFGECLSTSPGDDYGIAEIVPAPRELAADAAATASDENGVAGCFHGGSFLALVGRSI
jgi:hypothetical protein